MRDYFFGKYLEKGERIVAVFHRHPFVMGPELLAILAVGFIIPAFLWYLFPEFAALFVLWMLVSCVRLVRAVLIWYHDALLLTNVSMIDTHWHGFFDRTSTRLEYNMIEGTSIEVRGFRRMLFNYGKISVQRGGGTNPMVLEDVINPRQAETRIMEFQQKYMTHRNIKDSDTLKQILSTMVQKHAKEAGPENIT